MDFTGWVIVVLLIVVFLAFAYFMFTQESRMLGRLAVALGGENRSSVLGGNYVARQPRCGDANPPDVRFFR